MCFKAGKDELDTVRSLMLMSLSAVLSEALDVDIDDIRPTSHLIRDLGMTPEGAEALRAGIAEYFDGLEVDLTTTPTVGALTQAVVLKEFQGLNEPSADTEAPMEYRQAA